jgi:hypothetical protein
LYLQGNVENAMKC